MKLYARFFKRKIDFIFALAFIFLLFPVLIFIASLVWLFLGNPILFKQPRPGLYENEFFIYKFRTMTNDKDEDGNLLPEKYRMTRFGKLLRKTSLDEIPEILNILKGDMSFIGPRPLLMKYLPYFTEEERIRHSVKPGITGLAQVSGRNFLNWDDRFKKDIEYVNTISFLTDLKIIIRSIFLVLKGSDILEYDSALTSKIKNLDEERGNHDG